MLSQGNDVITFQQSPMALTGSISFPEQYRNCKRCAPSQKSILWNILDSNESVLWNIFDTLPI